MTIEPRKPRCPKCNVGYPGGKCWSCGYPQSNGVGSWGLSGHLKKLPPDDVGSEWIHRDALKVFEPVLACCYEIEANGCAIDKVLAQRAIDRTWKLLKESITGMTDD